MLEATTRGRERPAHITPKTGKTTKQRLQNSRSDHNETGERTQWTVKGINKDTLELSRRAARKRGMKFGAWVNEVLRSAASDEDFAPTGSPRELLTKMAELEFKLERSVGELKETGSNIQHDVRVLQLLMPKST